MDALRELHLVRCIAGQCGDFLRLGNDAPSVAFFAVQLALRVVGSQQVFNGEALARRVIRELADGAGVCIALPQLHAITGSITLSQEQFLNRTGVSFQRAAGLQLHARNLAGVGVVNRQRSVGGNVKRDIERLRSAACSGILDRQSRGIVPTSDANVITLAADSFAIQIQRR